MVYRKYLLYLVLLVLVSIGLVNSTYSKTRSQSRYHHTSSRSSSVMISDYNHIELKEEMKLYEPVKLRSRLLMSVAATPTSTSEKSALLDLYNQCNGPNWTIKTNWSSTTDPCVDNWYGVTCNSTGSIISIQLEENGLTGSIPSSFANLIHLETIILDNNMLEGDLGSALFQNMNNLSWLQIQNNMLTGDISWTSNLPITITFLWVAGNLFTGSIPKDWGKYTKLDLVFLELNQLSGSIPKELGQLPALRLFDCGFNQINGSVPEEIGNLTTLTHFWAYDNTISGSIPLSFGSMPRLVMFEFTRNKMSGEIPSNLFSPSSALQSIRLAGNNFTGNLNWICGLTHIVEVLLDDNKFSTLPICIVEAPQTLVNFVLTNNQLYSEIPIEFGNFTSIRFINLRKNQFYGTFPASFSNLVNLSRLDISENNINCTLEQLLNPIKKLPLISIIKANSNQITGEFNEDMFWDSESETELLKSVFLLDLSKNKISGGINDYLSWMLSLSEMDLSYNLLEGTIPEGLNFLDELRLDHNNLVSPTGELPSFMKPSSNFVKLEHENFGCPTIIGSSSEMRISIDSSYYNYSLCQCEIGTRGVNGSCSDCPEHAVCYGNGTEILIPAGFFPMPTIKNPEYLLRCQVSNFGTTSCNPNSLENYQCSAGYHDRLCSRCLSGYYTRGSECKKCPNGPESIVIFVAVLLLFLVVIIFFVLTNPQKSLPSSTRKTIVFYYQMLNLMLTKLSPWPTFFSFYYSSSSVINFSFGFLCIGDFSKYPNLFMVMVSLPPIILGLTILFLFIMWMSYSLRGKAFDYRWLRSSIRVNLLSLNFLYLPLCIYTLQNYSCTLDPIADKSYMSFFPWIECSSNTIYPNVLKATIATTIIYIIGIPLLFSYLLFKYRNRLDDPNVLAWLGSLYIDYRKKMYWYEMVRIGHRFMCAVSLLLNPKSSFSVFIVLLVIGSSIISQISFRPFIYEISNYTELLGNSVLLFAYICVLILSSLKTSLQYGSKGIEVILAVVIVVYTIYLAFVFILSLKYFLPRKLQDKIDMKLLSIYDEFKQWKLSNELKNRDIGDDNGYEPNVDPVFLRSSSQHVGGIELRRRHLSVSTSNTQDTEHKPDRPPPMKQYKSAPSLENSPNLVGSTIPDNFKPSPPLNSLSQSFNTFLLNQNQHNSNNMSLDDSNDSNNSNNNNNNNTNKPNDSNI